ncbi:phosphatidylserine decarboxylase-domain-containing protein [Radiomyces spectabilis]|uniref:phosphatidylserine decarboxylase-domain-containing protein n=1 Tax=Radiomyces spectabilis TaxID=64574 RepID=UPI0022208D83|nr:phosphatidylserine decarboxylase-domain-containing protein [Radiomyces spectabilis]KAI8384882.1 phosphatidylserine decarboxylase-domain-containing protein [Radiomyces spectabilis]
MASEHSDDIAVHEDVEAHAHAQDTDALMDSFSSAVDRTAPGANIVEGGVHSPAARPTKHWYDRRLTGWIQMHVIPNSFKRLVEKQLGVFVILRTTGEYHYEEMPIYTRIGMHLMFAGRVQTHLVETGTMHKLFLRESVRQGSYFDDEKSATQIPSFVNHYAIDMSQFEPSDIKAYKTFNEFFHRAIRVDARPIAELDNKNVIVSAADCRLNVFGTVKEATTFWIKGNQFTLERLLQNDELASSLTDGSMAIFRLAPQDYHRWHSPMDGTVESIQTIDGSYYTVNPCVVKENINVFTENHRVIIVMRSPHGFRYAVVAIGALLVGSIVLTKAAQPGSQLRKGDEMGYFQYGGSSVIVVFPKDHASWDSDLTQNSTRSFETKVTMGEHIGNLV